MIVKTVQRGYKLFEYARTIIPGGSQLFGKRAELYAPGVWPSYYKSAAGCKVTDLGGREFYDFTMVGTGTCVLGYSNAFVNSAVIRAVNSGSICTLNNLEEVELAELLIKLNPGLDMVRYARGGGEILTVAIRIARAYTRKDHVAVCGYHGWHDWYLSANLTDPKYLDSHLLPHIRPIGVPSVMSNLTIPFDFNSLESLEKVLASRRGKFAAIVLEPFRDNGPDREYLIGVRKLANQHSAVLIFDEVTSGFRETLGGMYLSESVQPDLVTFGKTISNGIPMAALVGRREVMESFTETFISSTYWGDRTGPAAALATIAFMERYETGRKIKESGLKIKKILIEASKKANLPIRISGVPSLLTYRLEVSDWPAALTYIIREMLARGILTSDRIYANYSHDEASIHAFEQGITEVFWGLSEELSQNTLHLAIDGKVKATGFNRVKL